jgi:DNA-binding transcriptional LysR family regulator
MHPDVAVELVLSNRIADLMAQEIDVALRIGHLADSSLVARQVGEVRHLVLASPAYLAHRGEPITPSDLAQHDIALQSTENGPADWQFHIPGQGIASLRPRARFTVNQAESAIAAAVAGYGLIRVLSYQAAGELASGSLVRVLKDHEVGPVPVNLVFTSARFMPSRTRAFIDFALEALRRLDMGI